MQCIEYACEDLGLKGLTRIFFVVTGKVMMLAILAEKKKKKKLNERCVLCPAQKYQRSKLFIPTYGNRDSRPGKIFACRIWNLGIFFDESEILGFGIQNLAQSTGIWKCYPSSKDKKSGINPVPGIQNEQHEIQNPRLSWITLQ